MSLQVNVWATQSGPKRPSRAMKRNKYMSAKKAERAGVRVETRRVNKMEGDKVQSTNVCGNWLSVDRNPGWEKKQVAAEKQVGKRVPRGFYDHILIPRLINKPRGFSLTHDPRQIMENSETLTPRERELLVKMLFNPELALLFDMSEIGLLSTDIEPPHVIGTIPHKPWQEERVKTLRPREKEVIDIIKVPLETGIVE